jgi:hypothetical protein
MTLRSAIFFRVLGAAALMALGILVARGAEPAEEQLRALAEQNRQLAEQVKQQQKMIEALAAQVADIKKDGARQADQLRDLREHSDGPAVAVGHERAVRVAGETGIAFFQTGSAGQFPKAEFRADDPTITIEAPVIKDVYFFGEMKLLMRETNVDSFQLGELYVDFENVSAAWGRSGQLGVRAGRINTPFGEEYLVRGPVANPLISHSLSDVWGTDEGVEAYGQLGPVSYVLAVQNGGVSRLRDFNADKALVARFGWEPASWLHLSASAMRTGELATVADNLSDVWFANAFFRALGAAKNTPTFWADLDEADAVARWKSGHVGAALGQIHFDDSDTTADNSRRIRYGYLEAVQALTAQFFAAARYSEIRAPGGYPLAGWGAPGTFFYRPSLTEELRRLSLGLGWRFGEPLVLKLEYTWESGRMLNGAPRDQENFFGAEVGLKF